MARLDVEYTERAFDANFTDNLLQAMNDYQERNITAFLASLEDPNFVPPIATRDIYFYLPLRMLNIFPTVRNNFV